MGLLLTNIGAGFTQVAVFASLSDYQSMPFLFAIAFALTLAPALLTSEIGARLTPRLGPLNLLLVSEIGGLCSLVVPLAAVKFQSQYMFVAAMFFPSFFAGLAISSFGLICKINLRDEDMPAVATIDTAIFSATVFVGTGFGALLYPLVHIFPFLAFDAASYIVAIALIVGIRARLSSPTVAAETIAAPDRKVLNVFKMGGEERYIFWISPLLALVTAPAMALLPAFGSKFSSISLGAISVTPTVALIFARSFGQLIGPFLVAEATMKGPLKKIPVLGCAAASFVLIYGILFMRAGYWVAFALVIIAHALTNVISTAVDASVFRIFDADRLPILMARRFQLQVVILTAVGLLAGKVADNWSIEYSYISLTLVGLAIFFSALFCLSSSSLAHRKGIFFDRGNSLLVGIFRFITQRT